MYDLQYLKDSAYYNKQKQIPNYTLSGILPGDSASIKELSLQTMIEAGVYDIEIAADSVIMSVGYNPTPIAKKGGKVRVIGDASKVGNLRTVIWGAWDVCMKI